MATTGMILKSAIGLNVLVEWRIGNFFFLSQGGYYISPHFSFNGVKWSLGIYPNGCSSFGNVTLHLRKKSSDSPIRQEFSLSLKTVRGEKYNEKLCTKDFERFHGIHELLFLPRSELSLKQYDLLPGGALTVVCIMKRTTFARNTKVEASNAKVNKSLTSPMAGSAESVASGSNQTGTIKIKESAKPEASGSNQTGTIKIEESPKPEASGSNHAGTIKTKESEVEASNAKVNKSLTSPMAGSAESVASGSNQTGTIKIKESAKPEASGSNQTGTIKIEESAKPEASGSNHAGTIKTKESVLKWIKEICAETSKGTKRKIEEENVLKWIQENCKETSEGKKRKMEEENSEACTSGSSITPQQKKVLHDLKELFCKKQGCDVIIKVKGSEFPAHRFILKARSPVFASTLQHDRKENATGIVEIEDCDPSYFSDFLNFLYCGDLGMISKENVFALFTAANKYEVLDLKEKCLEFLKKNMTVETFSKTITFALQHSETELIELANNFFVKNAKEIISTVKWQTFVVENPVKSNELFMKFVNSVQHGNA